MFSILIYLLFATTLQTSKKTKERNEKKQKNSFVKNEFNREQQAGRDSEI